MGCTQSVDEHSHINHKLYGITAKKPNTKDHKTIVKIIENLDEDQLKVVKIPQAKSKDPFFTPFSPGPSRSVNEEQLKRIKSNDMKFDLNNSALSSPKSNMKITLQRPNSLSSVSSATSNALGLVPNSALSSARSTSSGNHDRQLVMKTISPKLKLESPNVNFNLRKKSLSILEFISIDNNSRCNSPAINLANNNLSFSREASPFIRSLNSSPSPNLKVQTYSTTSSLPPVQVPIPFIETTRGNRSLRVSA